MKISGAVNPQGMVLEFGEVKKLYRSYLDGKFDHHLVLYENDPLVIYNSATPTPTFPGLAAVPYDPTTENVADDIYQWAQSEFGPNYHYEVELWETSVNSARVGGPL